MGRDLTVYVPADDEDMVEAARQRAKANRQSLSAWILIAIQEKLARDTPRV